MTQGNKGWGSEALALPDDWFDNVDMDLSDMEASLKAGLEDYAAAFGQGGSDDDAWHVIVHAIADNCDDPRKAREWKRRHFGVLED